MQNFAALLAQFDQAFPSYLPKGDHAALIRLSEAMAYAALAPGKRLRPYLVLETGRLFHASQGAIMAAAAAIECVHVYSLVHDDLPAMDDDDERRGQPTVHKKYDEATAILAGDALLTLAFGILGEHAPQLVKPLADAAGFGGMVGGQMMDLAAEQLTTPMTLPETLRLQAMKTGALFDFCTQSGAILGNATEEEKAALKDYTAALGLLFQLTDDVLDAEGDPTLLGKAVRKDAEAGKATVIRLLGLAQTKQLIAEKAAVAKAALGALKEKGREVENLAGLIDFIQNRKK